MILKRERNRLGAPLARMLVRNRRALVGLLVFLAVFVIGLLAPYIAPHDPSQQDLDSRLMSPTVGHWFGTDGHGRDILSRTMYGARYSLAIGICSTAIGLILGSLAGTIAGLSGGKVDLVLMRLIDIVMAFPGILVALVFVAFLGPGFANVVVAIGIYSVPQFARILRAETLAIKERDFVIAARSLGASNLRILTKHILPNAMAALLVLSTLRSVNAILTAASLGFLGLGLDPSLPEWGAMLSEARDVLRVAPHAAIAPGLAMTLTLLSLNFLGDFMRDASDPVVRRMSSAP